MLPSFIIPLERQRKAITSTGCSSQSSSVNNKTNTKNSTNKPIISMIPTTSMSSKKRPLTSITSSTNAKLQQKIDMVSQIHPSEYARAAFKANGFSDIEAIAKDSETRFVPPTPAMLAAYNTSIVQEVRNNNLEGVKQLYKEGAFQYGVNACNRFGESILHIACRRGHLDMVKFLIEEVGLSVSAIRDDYHRTPLHDAFWTSTASPDVVDYLLQQPYVTSLLMSKDKRGFTPLDYSRGEDRGKWLRFLWERKDRLKPYPLARGSLADLIEKVDSAPQEDECSPAKRQKIVA